MRSRISGRLFILAFYSAALAVVAVNHEPWFDEAQAWLLARDSSLLQLVFNLLPYEGHPPLWYLILAAATALGAPYWMLTAIGCICGVIGVGILLRLDKLPWTVVLLAPFTYFIFYQYSVVARSYVLLPALFFGLAAVYHSRFEKPVPFFTILIMMASCSAYTYFFAAGLMAVDLVSWPRIRLGGVYNKAFVGGAVILTAWLVLMAILFWPPLDGTFARGWNWEPGRIFSRAWRQLDGALVENRWWSAAVLAGTLWWFYLNRVLAAYLVTTLAVLSFGAVKYSNVWHQGILFLIWFFACAVSFSAPPGQSRASGSRYGLARRAAVLLMLSVLLRQTWWSGIAAANEVKLPYSGSKALAGWIKENGIDGRKIFASNFYTLSVLPYFDRNIFYNLNSGQAPSHYRWAKDSGLVSNLDRIPLDKPDILIFGVVLSRHNNFPRLPDYAPVGCFNGKKIWKDRFFKQDSYFVFQRLPATIPVPPNIQSACDGG